MICLGIESTAHTFGISIVTDTKILSNCKRSFTTEDGEGGMILYQVADHHVAVIQEVLQEALTKAQVKCADITLIAFSQSPGIGPMLRIGAMTARTLSIELNIPLIGVNHCIAHLEIGRFLTNAKDPILVYASGANTQIIGYASGKYRVFGETLDIGIGNFLDQLGRMLGLGFPAGPKIGILANKYRNSGTCEYIKLPYSIKGMDVGFGGILTYIKDTLLGIYPVEQICYCVEETVYSMLCEVAERALAHCNKNEIVLGGGVACAPRLQEMCKIMCEARGAKSYVLPNEYNVDNAAMISVTGMLMFKAGERTQVADAKIDAYLRTDDVAVTWR